VLDEQVLPLTKKGHPKKLASSNFTDREKTFDRLHIRQSFARSRLSAELPHSAFPHFRALQQELAQWAFFYFEPRERMRRPDAVQETRRLGGRGENLASFLNTLRATEPRQFAVVERALHLLIPSLSGVELGVNERGVMELHLRENGALIPASLLSDGTLRLLGMLALSSMKDKPTLIGFEEPENGVHPRRMRLIAELLKSYVFSGETQMIVTTHSPTLLDALPRENLYVCRKREGSTTITPLNQLDPLGLDTSITYALDGADDELMVSERVLRGDFDA
jgi:predicted ATPase